MLRLLNAVNPFIMIQTILFGLILIVMTTILLFIGVRGLINKNVTVVSSRWIVLIVALGFLPNTVRSLSSFEIQPVLTIINLAIYFSLIAFCWFLLRGILLFGSNEENLKNGMESVFSKLGRKYEWGISSVTLDDGSKFSFSLQEWIGNAQLKAKNKEAKKLISSLSSEASKHYKNTTYSINSATYWLYTLIGTILLIVIIILIGYFSG